MSDRKPGASTEPWRRALAGKSGRAYLESALELTEGAEMARELARDPDLAASSDLRRRDFLELLGASIALAGLGGCLEMPVDEALPYVDQPPEATPGVPQRYATSMILDGFATGLLARSNDGRPTKLEGNPEHPASLGATGVFEQASVLGLYDPHRLRAPRHRGRPSSWRAFFDRVLAAPGGAPWFVLPPQSSPLLADLVAEVRRRRPGTRVTYHAPLDRRPVYGATRTSFGEALDPQLDFRRADRVLALDADFVSGLPMSVRWARDFAARRRLAAPDADMSRLYVVEPAPTPTGSIADHRLPVRASDVAPVAAAVLAALVDLGRRPAALRDPALAAVRRLARGADATWAGAVARDLAAHPGASIVVAGPRQPEVTHVLAHLLDEALENRGRTVVHTPSALLEPDGGASLEELAAALDAGEVDTLVVLEGNPVYTAPADLELGRRFAKARRSVHLTLHDDETSAACEWVLPAAHYLESWGDGRAYDGTVSFVQPLVRPLYGGRTATQLLAAFAGQPDVDDRELLRRRWQPRLGETGWQQALQRGFVSGTPEAPATGELDGSAIAAALGRAAQAEAPPGLELCFEASHAVYDGRFANNGWLLELPHPTTKLTWDNAALISPAEAARLGVDSQDVVRLQLGDRELEAPVLVTPGHADGAVSLALGYGRQGTEALARGVGVDAYRLRTTSGLHAARGLQVSRTGARHPLAITQVHRRLHDRDIAPHSTLEDYRAHPDFTARHRGPQNSLLPEVFSYARPEQWAMTIDTMICTGCSSCMIACQAENNVPIVGKEGVRRGREMHWLRIDSYHEGDDDDPEVLHQPMLCQHCEKAPCEYVCPVFATVHSPDGLNEMVYNRCVGTRFCSNNCPYKVRRFNYFELNEGQGTTRLQKNPDVTVRARGVMEKCTFCVQRIRGAGIQARMEDRGIRPGEVQTACQQACPTGAIQFDSLMHEDTPMVAWRKQPRAYAVLHHLGTRPRVHYLAKIAHRNPELA